MNFEKELIYDPDEYFTSDQPSTLMAFRATELCELIIYCIVLSLIILTLPSMVFSLNCLLKGMATFEFYSPECDKLFLRLSTRSS